MSTTDISMRPILASLFCLFIQFSAPVLPVCAMETPDSDSIPFNSSKYEDLADWVLTLRAQKLETVLKFNRSPFHPLTCVNVTIKQRKGGSEAWDDERNYETFWFREGKPLGCRRHQKLELAKHSHGIIKIVRTQDSQQNTRALVNTVLRLLPEIDLLKAVALVVVMPQEMCRNAETDLSSFRFYRAKMATGNASALLLHVVSDQSDYDRYFSYSVKYGEILK